LFSNFLSELWRVTVEVAPSLSLGLAAAGLLHVVVNRERVFSHLGRPGLASTVRASLWGVPLPLCSCGVIPAALSLRRDGASPGATTAFLISTPQTGVDSVMVTAGILGLPVALAKLAGAFVAGVIGGVLADSLPARQGWSGGGAGVECSPDSRRNPVARIWNHAFGVVFRDIYRWLAFGLAVSALISTFVHPDAMAGVPWLRGPLGMIAALAVGIPLYVCSTASVPIAAGLVRAGFAPGAALVFLMAGPATNAATIGAVRKTLGGRVLFIYLSTIIVVSLLTGLLLDGLLGGVAGGHVHSSGLLPGVLRTAAGVLLAAGTAWWAVRDTVSWISSVRASKAPEAVALRVSGMSCGSCERRVRNALAALPGVRSVAVSREEGIARIEASPGFDRASAAAAISGLGYGVDDDPPSV